MKKRITTYNILSALMTKNGKVYCTPEAEASIRKEMTSFMSRNEFNASPFIGSLIIVNPIYIE
jgi:hypothetical protein